MPSVSKQNRRTKTNSRKVKGILDRVTSLQEAIPTDGLKINLYGQSGTGKTTFWATFPKKILALVCSGGNKAGELLTLNTPEYHKTIDVLKIESSMDLLAIVKELRANPGTYSTVVLDHASGLQDLILAEILNIEEVPAQKSWGLAKREQWGQVAIQTKEHLRALLGLENTNVIIVAQERDFGGSENDEEDLGIAPFIASGLIPSVVKWLHPAVDYILNTYKRQKTKETITKVGPKGKEKKIVTTTKVKGVDYVLRTVPHPIYATKFRMPKESTVVLADIVDPDYNKFMKLVEGK